MFSSLSNRNFRIFFLAISFSVIGTFAQELAQAWLVLDLTHSAADLGLVVGLQFLPMLVLGPWGGVLSDRYSRRRILLITQALLAVLVFALWALTITGLINVWMVDIFALCVGITGAVNTPTRLGFLHELVGEEGIHNAVSLNSTVYSTGRVLGPSLAGLLIVGFGVAPAFFINGLSFLGVILALMFIRSNELHLVTKTERAPKQLRAGFRHVTQNPVLAATIMMTLIVGIFTAEFPVSFPALARLTFHGNAATLSVLMSALGLGSVIGGLVNARQKKPPVSAIPSRAAMLGAAVLLVAIAPWVWLTAVVALFVGFSMVRFSAFANGLVQLHSLPIMRGRVLALWTSAWVGSTAFGGPIIGWISQNASPRWALGVGAVAALVAAAVGSSMLKSHQNSSPEPAISTS